MYEQGKKNIEYGKLKCAFANCYTFVVLKSEKKCDVAVSDDDDNSDGNGIRGIAAFLPLFYILSNLN